MNNIISNNKNIGVFGFSGRLGREVVSLFEENGYKLVFSKDDKDEIRKEGPNLLIDCSLSSAFDKNLKIVEEFEVPLILATTGLSVEQFEHLKLLSEKIPVVQSNNYSYGVQVLLNLVKSAEEKLNNWDIEITETHHRFKKDKPSGTAKMIRNIIKKENVNISSLRLGNVFGDHTVKFGGLGEIITISHSATSRRTFAEGIFKSAEFILQKENGIYSFSDVVNS